MAYKRRKGEEREREGWLGLSGYGGPAFFPQTRSQFRIINGGTQA